MASMMTSSATNCTIVAPSSGYARNFTLICDDESMSAEPMLWCLLLALFPVTCIFGNSLVVLAVLSERTLQTSTNYLLVSLAAADMLVASLVMPFAVYLTVNQLHWYLPDAVCNFFCVADVSASTASIVHLVAISIDRFYAVVKHMEYKTLKHQSRVYGTILFCWIFSIAIGLPLGIGLNYGDNKSKHRCGIVNPYYMFYSSIFAFYIPCTVMGVMYGFVFYQLHKRLRAVRLQEMAAAHMVNFGDHLGKIMEGALGDAASIRKSTVNWALPFLKSIEQTIANMADNEDVSMEEIDELTTILHTLETDNKRLMVEPQLSNDNSVCRTQSVDSQALDNHGATESTPLGGRLKKRFASLGVVGKRSSIFVARQKIRVLKTRALELLMRIKSKQGMAIRKESRATKLVATVMLVFLLCYMPFFTTNIVKVFKLWNGTWTNDLEQAFIVFTWLGYLNSCLNPVIYSLFNRKFRATFRKLLHCPSNKESIYNIRKAQHRFYSSPYMGSVMKTDGVQNEGMSETDLDYRLSLVRKAREQLHNDKRQGAKLSSALLAVQEEPAGFIEISNGSANVTASHSSVVILESKNYSNTIDTSKTYLLTSLHEDGCGGGALITDDTLSPISMPSGDYNLDYSLINSNHDNHRLFFTDQIIICDHEAVEV